MYNSHELGIQGENIATKYLLVFLSILAPMETVNIPKKHKSKPHSSTEIFITLTCSTIPSILSH